MLTDLELKTWLHQDLPPGTKILLLLTTFKVPCQIKEIISKASEIGFRVPKKWNLSSLLERTKGLAIRTTTGWELSQKGIDYLRGIGVSKLSPAAAQVAVDLRAELATIKNAETRRFVEEAIKCYEHELYRSAIVMSWLAAIDVLHSSVLARHLAAFNAEATRANAKWKPAKTSDDLGLMPEGEFLDRMVAISALGKNVKAELKNCLDRRNGCGHPNSLKISANTAAHHIEILILNVFKVF